MPHTLSAKHRLLFMLVPMLATFAATRLFLHLGGVWHIYPGGYLFHHLFTGILLVIPAAFIAAFGVRDTVPARLTLIVLGVGSALILDEIVFLVATQGSDLDYTSALSLWGGVACIAAASLLLIVIWRFRHRSATSAER